MKTHRIMFTHIFCPKTPKLSEKTFSKRREVGVGDCQPRKEKKEEEKISLFKKSFFKKTDSNEVSVCFPSFLPDFSSWIQDPYFTIVF